MAPTLTVIAPNLPSEMPSSQRTLSLATANRLASLYGTQTPGFGCASHASTVVGIIRSRSQWISCDCGTSKSLDKQALLFPRAGATYTLLRGDGTVPGRYDHDQGCPFTKAGAAGKIPRTPFLYELADRTPVSELGFYNAGTKPPPKKASTVSAPVTSATPRASARARKGLGSVLYSVMERSGLQEFSEVPQSDVISQWRRIVAALSSFQMYSSGPSAKDFSVTRFGWSKTVERKLINAASAPWPAELVPHGFLFDAVATIRELPNGFELISSRGEAVFVNGGVTRPGAKTKGPWLAVVLMATPPGSLAPQLIQAYLHPIFDSANLCLVDSQKERETLAILTTACKIMHRAEEVMHWSVEKPVVDRKIAGVSARPDFIVTVDGKICTVETMGFAHPEYLLRKQRLQTVLAQQYSWTLEHVPPDKGTFKTLFADWLVGRVAPNAVPPTV